MHSYYMGITSFADISRKEFLKIYVGIEDSAVLEDKGDYFSTHTILNHYSNLYSTPCTAICSFVCYVSTHQTSEFHNFKQLQNTKFH